MVVSRTDGIVWVDVGQNLETWSLALSGWFCFRRYPEVNPEVGQRGTSSAGAIWAKNLRFEGAVVMVIQVKVCNTCSFTFVRRTEDSQKSRSILL